MERHRPTHFVNSENVFITHTDAIRRYHDGETIVKFTAQPAYLIKSGEIFVYATRWINNRSGKLSQLCTLKKGDILPTFAYEDEDHVQWRFIVKAKSENAVLEEVPLTTSVVRMRFAQKAELKSGQAEGFERSIIERFNEEDLKGPLYDGLVKKHITTVLQKTRGLITRLFSRSDSVSIQDDDPCMRSIRFACSYLKMNDIDFKQVKQSCSHAMSVPAVTAAAQILCREVVLEPDWFRHDCGVIIGTIGKTYVTCVPHGLGYEIYYSDKEIKEKLTKETAQKISPAAFSIERSLPAGSIIFKDFIRFGIKDLYIPDVILILALGLVAALIGILLPTLNQKVYDDYIPLGDTSKLAQICLLIGSFMIGNLFFSIVKTLAEFRLQSRIGYRIQDAAYHRVFRLPERFFRTIDSADLAGRLMSTGGAVNAFVSSFVITGLSAIFALIYLVKMFDYQSKLTWIAILMLLIQIALQAGISVFGIRFQRRIAEQNGKADAKLYQYLNGIPKIRMAGAEERAIYDYMVPYTETEAAQLKESRISSVSEAISAVASTIFSMVLYYFVAGKPNASISMGAFIGFNTAFGAFSGSFGTLVNKVLSLYHMKPIIERFKPIFETPCEDVDMNQLPEQLTGAVTVSHASFAYEKGGCLVINDLSLDVKSGEYIGIVGSSGCGKSTLLKLLLGFEIPDTGQITYDGNDLKSINKNALRKQMGVVLQDGGLIAGSINENITITAPKATRKDVLRVIEEVGLKDDISQMPMGLETVLSESSGTISGGQRQRILIARAIISRPKILIFDEATSALDNITQEMVSESLDKMHVTRIVVAHRLSTIKNCDRIIVMDQGRIVEEGDYNTLMRRKGLFYELAIRQIADGGEEACQS